MAVAPALLGAGGGGIGLSSILGGVTGLAGLFGGKGQRQKANEYSDQAANLLGLQGRGQSEALQLAEAFNPRQEAQQSVDAAAKVAGNTIQNSLKDLTVRFKDNGGDVGGDTAFNVGAQRTVDDVANPLALFAADKFSGATMDKIRALTGAISSGGSAAAGYMNLADQNRPDTSASISLLGNALQGLFRRSAPTTAKIGGVDRTNQDALPPMPTSNSGYMRRPMRTAMGY